MPIDFTPENKKGIGALHEALFGELKGYQLSTHEFNRQGRAEGVLVGGNLSILYALQGTPYAVRGDNIILLIEDIDEYLYHIDRMMVSLKLSGLLQNIKGLIVGGMTGMRDNAIPFGKTAYEIIREHTDLLNIPVCFGFSAGHIKPNNALYFGRKLALNVEDSKVRLEYM
jgi:muramoyltetrapeptide carboxypeptidase